jgi:hypothetical protein
MLLSVSILQGKWGLKKGLIAVLSIPNFQHERRVQFSAGWVDALANCRTEKHTNLATNHPFVITKKKIKCKR